LADRLGFHGHRLVCAGLKFLRDLENSTVHQQPFAGRFDEVFRTRNASSRAQKSEFCHRRPFYRVCAPSAVEPWCPSKSRAERVFRSNSPRSFFPTNNEQLTTTNKFQSAAMACFFATIDSMFSPSPFATPVPYAGSAL